MRRWKPIGFCLCQYMSRLWKHGLLITENIFKSFIFCIWFMLTISVNANSLYCGLKLFKLLKFLLISFGSPVNILWYDRTEVYSAGQSLFHAHILLVFFVEQVLSPRHLADGVPVSNRTVSLNKAVLIYLRRLQSLEASNFFLCSTVCIGKPACPKHKLNSMLFYRAHFTLRENKLQATSVQYKLSTKLRQQTMCSSACFLEDKALKWW